MTSKPFFHSLLNKYFAYDDRGLEQGYDTDLDALIARVEDGTLDKTAFIFHYDDNGNYQIDWSAKPVEKFGETLFQRNPKPGVTIYHHGWTGAHVHGILQPVPADYWTATAHKTDPDTGTQYLIPAPWSKTYTDAVFALDVAVSGLGFKL